MKWKEYLLISIWGLLLYTSTLAPTVLWFDEGHLQLRAVMGDLGSSAGHHPLWVWVAHQFSKLPVGELAGRVNFVSAFFGTCTLLVLLAIFFELDLDRKMGFAAAMAFSVSHTFWSYAVKAETYALTIFLMSLHVLFALKWYNSYRFRYLLLLACVTGLGFSTHLMMALYLPGLSWLLFVRRKHLSIGRIVLSGLSFLAGTALLLALLFVDAGRLNLSLSDTLYRAVFTFDGYSFSSSFFDFSLDMLWFDIIEWLSFLTLQFLGLAGIAAIIGFWRCLRFKPIDSQLGIYLLLLFLGVMVFSFSYRIGERYAFYLPSYFPISVCILIGLQWLWERTAERVVRLRGALFGVLLAILVVVPVALYYIAPAVVARGITYRDSRHVPGPSGARYFLWPPKNDYWDARVFAESTLHALPDDAVLLADPVLASPIVYLQRVESLRPDVVVHYCCWDIEARIVEYDDRPIAIADVAPEIYPVEWLQSRYNLTACGPVFLLE